MDTNEFRRHAHALVDWIADYRERMASLPVMSRSEPGAIRARFPAAPPVEGGKVGEALAALDGTVLPGITHWNHPAFFAYFPANTSLASILGDLAAAGLAAQGMSWQTSPAATEVEQVVMGWIRQMIGLPEAFSGVVQDTASVSTLTALLCARERTSGFSQNGKGLQRGDAPMTVYASEQGAQLQRRDGLVELRAAQAPARREGAGPRGPRSEKPEAPERAFEPVPGAAVRILSLDREGVVLSIRDDRAEVRMGNATFAVRRADLAPPGAAPAKAAPAASPRGLAASLASLRQGPSRDEAPLGMPTPPLELHLLGRTVEEALCEVDKFLDDASRAGRTEARIVHGHDRQAEGGDPRLPEGARPSTRSARGRPREGGDGATVVTLR